MFPDEGSIISPTGKSMIVTYLAPVITCLLALSLVSLDQEKDRYGARFGQLCGLCQEKQTEKTLL